MTNIPIYRAKKQDSDEWVEGYLNKNMSGKFVIENERVYKIDPSTLAIHFDGMLDKNGKKIFASLNEDGVGGDDIKFGNTTHSLYSPLEGCYSNLVGMVIYRDCNFCVTDKDKTMNYWLGSKSMVLVEVIGIHKDSK